MSSDPNNRPGGPRLIVTCKSADRIQFFDAGTLAMTGDIAMPGSTHELVRSPDGVTAFGSVYGGGIFGKNKNPDRRIAVIDLPSQRMVRIIDVGADVAPHSLMMDAAGTLWCSGELGNSIFAVDPANDGVQRIDIGAAAHWIAVSHSANKLFASFKAKTVVAAINLVTRAVIATLDIADAAEGIAVTPDGGTLFVCAHGKGVFHEFDTMTHALRRTHVIDGAPGKVRQLRRVRVSPDGRYVCVSSHVDCYAAVYDAATMKQLAGFSTPKAPMGFGFAADGMRGYLCCHDAAVVVEFELGTGKIIRQFPTAAGCEFIVAY